MITLLQILFIVSSVRAHFNATTLIEAGEDGGLNINVDPSTAKTSSVVVVIMDHSGRLCENLHHNDTTQPPTTTTPAPPVYVPGQLL